MVLQQHRQQATRGGRGDRAHRARRDREHRLNVHEKFGQAQEERYKRFSAALNTARGALRNDKAVMKEFNKFNRSMRGMKKRAS